MSGPLIRVTQPGTVVVTSQPKPVNVVTGPVQPVEVTAPMGNPGPVGPMGPPGPPGSGTGGSSFIFQQSTPAAVWTIVHELGYNANVTVVDSSGEQCEGEVECTALGVITVRFSAAFAGTAYLS